MHWIRVRFTDLQQMVDACKQNFIEIVTGNLELNCNLIPIAGDTCSWLTASSFEVMTQHLHGVLTAHWRAT